MTEPNQNPPRNNGLLLLVILLIVIVAAQAWHLVRMENELEALRSQQPAPQSQQEAITGKVPSSDTAQTAEPVGVDRQAQTTETSPLQETPLAQQLPPQNPLAYRNIPSYPPYHSPRRSPREEFERMRRYMDRKYYERNRGYPRRPDYQYSFRRHMSSPEISIRENDQQYMIAVNIPGTEKDSISVNLEGQRLTIRAKQGYEKQHRAPSGNFSFKERSLGRFQRSLTLTEPVDADAMKTRVDNDVLKIIIPKLAR